MVFVRSNYRAPWTGVIIGRIQRKPLTLNGTTYKLNDLCQVLVIIDRHGNRMTRRVVCVLDAGYLVEVDGLDLSQVNPDWLKCRDQDWR